MSDYPVIRKPFRLYPLPPDIRDLDFPWPDVASSRHARISQFQEGYNYGDNPIIRKPGTNNSDLLTKL